MPADQPVFPEALQAAGYYTAISGKHHMGKAVNRGFDKVSGGKGPSKSADWVPMLQERPKDKPFFWFASSDTIAAGRSTTRRSTSLRTLRCHRISTTAR